MIFETILQIILKQIQMVYKALRATIPVLLAGILLLVVSCDMSGKLKREEKDKINTFLTDNSSLHFVKQTSGLYYLEVAAGTGDTPAVNDSVYLYYTGKLLDGSIFSTNVGTGVLYGVTVGQNMIGFDEGLTLMKAGGKAMFLIPSSLGYGSSGAYIGSYYISGYTPLLFDIQLVKVVRQTGR